MVPGTRNIASERRDLQMVVAWDEISLRFPMTAVVFPTIFYTKTDTIIKYEEMLLTFLSIILKYQYCMSVSTATCITYVIYMMAYCLCVTMNGDQW